METVIQSKGGSSAYSQTTLANQARSLAKGRGQIVERYISHNTESGAVRLNVIVLNANGLRDHLTMAL